MSDTKKINIYEDGQFIGYVEIKADSDWPEHITLKLPHHHGGGPSYVVEKPND